MTEFQVPNMPLGALEFFWEGDEISEIGNFMECLIFL